MPDHPPQRRLLRRATCVTAALVLALTACSDGGDEAEPDRVPSGSPSPSEPTSAAPAPALTTKATVRKVTGDMTPDSREKLKVKVTAAVDAWFDGAFVGGDYPRTDFDDAFASFTPGAQMRARTDLRLMTNADIGGSVDAVEVLARRIKIDALAVGGRATAVTVDFRLGMAFTGDVERSERVSGDLYLTYAPGGWKVFGYDVSRGQI